MTYQVSRNGQLYGPYSLEDLQRYVATGNVLLTDLAKSDDMPIWLPLSQGPAAPGTPIPAAPSPIHRITHGAWGSCWASSPAASSTSSTTLFRFSGPRKLSPHPRSSSTS